MSRGFRRKTYEGQEREKYVRKERDGLSKGREHNSREEPSDFPSKSNRNRFVDGAKAKQEKTLYSTSRPKSTSHRPGPKNPDTK